MPIIGTAIDMTALIHKPDYAHMVAREFDACVAEDAFKQYEVWKEPNHYDFTNTDCLARFAQANGMALWGAERWVEQQRDRLREELATPAE